MGVIVYSSIYRGLKLAGCEMKNEDLSVSRYVDIIMEHR